VGRPLAPPASTSPVRLHFDYVLLHNLPTLIVTWSGIAYRALHLISRFLPINIHLLFGFEVLNETEKKTDRYYHAKPKMCRTRNV
jgi:hypothetical protein